MSLEPTPLPAQNRIFLDYPLDILLNRDCRLRDYDQNIRKFLWDNRLYPNLIREKFQDPLGSLEIPSGKNPGSGNILIQGRPGTGKSILALQMAVAATIFPNHYISIFFSLEEHPEAVLRRCMKLGWGNNVCSTKFLDQLDDSSPPSEIGRSLERLLTQPPKCPFLQPSGEGSHRRHLEPVDINRKVLFPILSPRSISNPVSPQNGLFFERLRQIEKFLVGAKWLRQNPPGNPKDLLPEIRMVCIDSLSVFGDRDLSREELYQIFDLFRRYEVIGVFTAEEPVASKSNESTTVMEYLSDIVIRLREEEENGYALRFFEIKKSRFQHEIYGRHPLRLQPPGKNDLGMINSHFENNKPFLYQTMRIMPSIHHIVAATEGRFASDRNQQPFDFGNAAINSFLKQDMRRGSVIAIKGPLNSFKTTLARHFLLSGICKFNSKIGEFEGKESVLLIRMHDRTSFDPQGKSGKRWKVSEELGRDSQNNPIDLFHNPTKSGKSVQQFQWIKEKSDSNAKMTKNVWAYITDESQAKDRPEYGDAPRLIEVAFKSGALLPEEFLEVVRSVIHEHSMEKPPTRTISRVVFNDVGLIGASYPFLRRSSTAGSLFLPAFVHVMRNYNVDLVMTGTTGQLKEADEAVDLACELADSILHCDFIDVFGDRYVIVHGEGQTASQTGKSSSEFVPGVLLSKNSTSFQVNTNLLQGLVGFDTGSIHRPGIVIQLLTEGEIDAQYNNEIEMMMQSAFSVPREPTRKERSWGGPESAGTGSPDGRDLTKSGSIIEDRRRVSVVRFTSDLSEAVHDSLGVLEGKPIDRTMISSIDEFFMAEDMSKGEEKGLIDVAKIVMKDKTTEKDKKMERDKFLVSIGKGNIYGVPYYANVLMLAYREEIAPQLESTPMTWRKWANIIRSSNLGKLKLYPFDFDLLAQETLTCIFLDALVSGCKRTQRKKWDFNMSEFLSFSQNQLHDWDEQRGSSITDILRKGISEKQKESVVDELLALQYLFSKSRKYELRNNPAARMREDNRYLSGDSALYVCWYSHLRDLLNRQPELRTKLRVAPLPGGGFRGDFFLGIIKGSVSEALGRKVIELLCNKQEEYKRFVRGVGLPVTKRFYAASSSKSKGFLAWPSSKEKLNTVLQIHRNALTRSRIIGYRNYRPALHALSEMIAFSDAPGENVTRQCLQRLQFIIDKLTVS